MDMTLYALLNKQLQGQTECKMWNGFKIEVVSEVPKVQAPNTIYFVIINNIISPSNEVSIDTEES